MLMNRNNHDFKCVYMAPTKVRIKSQTSMAVIESMIWSVIQRLYVQNAIGIGRRNLTLLGSNVGHSFTFFHVLF